MEPAELRLQAFHFVMRRYDESGYLKTSHILCAEAEELFDYFTKGTIPGKANIHAVGSKHAN
mgnify:CR=1 FL=1